VQPLSRLTEIGPRRLKGELESSYRMRVARFSGLVALACALGFAATLAVRPGASALAFFLFIGLPLVGVTMALMGIGYLAGALFVRHSERSAPPASDSAALLQAAERPDFELAIHGSSQFGLALALCGLGAGGLLLSWEKSLLLFVCAIALLGLGALVLLSALSSAGKPKLTLSRGGFRTPFGPFISWSEVEGIHLRANQARGRVMSHSLMVRMPRLPQRIAEFSFFYRLVHQFRRGMGKETFHVVLRKTSQPPDLVYQLARSLWSRSTGRHYDWEPDMSPEFNEALRHPSDAGARLIGDELLRKSRVLKWLWGTAIAVFVLYIGLRLLG
jgi:hypothetical protein